MQVRYQLKLKKTEVAKSNIMVSYITAMRVPGLSLPESHISMFKWLISTITTRILEKHCHLRLAKSPVIWIPMPRPRNNCSFTHTSICSYTITLYIVMSNQASSRKPQARFTSCLRLTVYARATGLSRMLSSI